MSPLVFQSTPVIANGRIAQLAGEARTDISFNPRPLLLTGESSAGKDANAATAGFNPRPLLLTGESNEGDGEVADDCDVSIHARYC